MGLGPLVSGLATTSPGLFEALAKVDALHLWTFGLWWVAIVILMDLGVWVALLLTLVTFPGAHIFAWWADLFLRFVRW